MLGLFFGGCAIVLQVLAMTIMMSAARTTNKLTRDIEDKSLFQDVRRNRAVSIFICIGYSVDYAVDLVFTSLLLNGKIDYYQQQFGAIFGRSVLVVCVFMAFAILMKTFMTYQIQIIEADEKAKRK